MACFSAVPEDLPEGGAVSPFETPRIPQFVKEPIELVPVSGPFDAHVDEPSKALPNGLLLRLLDSLWCEPP
jgi:hypothetical protein